MSDQFAAIFPQNIPSSIQKNTSPRFSCTVEHSNQSRLQHSSINLLKNLYISEQQRLSVQGWSEPLLFMDAKKSVEKRWAPFIMLLFGFHH